MQSPVEFLPWRERLGARESMRVLRGASMVNRLFNQQLFWTAVTRHSLPPSIGRRIGRVRCWEPACDFPSQALSLGNGCG